MNIDSGNPERNQPRRRKRIPNYAYIDAEEYKRRLPIIQTSIYDALENNDQRFGGSDGIEGVLVFGSYAKSYPVKEGKVLVHEQYRKHRASDLDLAFLYESRENAPQLGELNAEDYKLTGLPPEIANLPRIRDWTEMMKHPYWRLSAALKNLLSARNLPIAPEHSMNLELRKPKEILEELSEGHHPIISGFGLVFIHPGSHHRDEILAILRRARLPMVLDPATTAEVLTPPHNTPHPDPLP